MQHLVDQFNRFFEGDAKVEIKNKRPLEEVPPLLIAELTIGTRTMIIDLPHISGGQSRPKD